MPPTLLVEFRAAAAARMPEWYQLVLAVPVHTRLPDKGGDVEGAGVGLYPADCCCSLVVKVKLALSAPNIAEDL